MRTNCVDCLDRTNTAQYVIAKAALGLQVDLCCLCLFFGLYIKFEFLYIYIDDWNDIFKQTALSSWLFTNSEYWLWLWLLPDVGEHVRRSWGYPCTSVWRITINSSVKPHEAFSFLWIICIQNRFDFYHKENVMFRLKFYFNSFTE